MSGLVSSLLGQEQATASATADPFASLRDDKQKGMQRQRQTKGGCNGRDKQKGVQRQRNNEQKGVQRQRQRRTIETARVCFGIA
jgi:hypothetical protein